MLDRDDPSSVCLKVSLELKIIRGKRNLLLIASSSSVGVQLLR